ncbi:hypothetical protein [Priestia aryabhattai]
MKEKAYFYTYYRTSYGVVRAKLRDKMEFNIAEELGKNYCKSNDYEYIGTFVDEYVNISSSLQTSSVDNKKPLAQC